MQKPTTIRVSIWVIFSIFFFGSQIAVAQEEIGCGISQAWSRADFDLDCDVDGDDFSHLENCASGPAIPLSDPACENVDLDHDGDVDQSDFGLWQLCLSGQDVPPDLRCENIPWYEGYGVNSAGGNHGETYRVTSLADSGPGTLRDGVVNRDYDSDGPRTIVFDVAGTIQLKNDIVVREPYLTIDGATAPPPGITITKTSIYDGEFIIAGTHDLIIRHLRFKGLWDYGGTHSNNAATITIDGDSGPDHVVQNVILDHITASNATDGGPDIWGEVRDLTIAWCFFHHNWHPTTVSHYPGPYQTRQRISLHHNLYAKNGERQPQLRADIRNFDHVNNIIYDWGYFGEYSGYGVRVRCRSSEPQVHCNIINNWFIPTILPSWALVYGISPGPDSDDGGPGGSPPAQGTVITTSHLGDVYVSGNILPPENKDHYSTIAQPLPVPDYAKVTTYDAQDLATKVLPYVGMLYRNQQEQAIIDEIIAE